MGISQFEKRIGRPYYESAGKEIFGFSRRPKEDSSAVTVQRSFSSSSSVDGQPSIV